MSTLAVVEEILRETQVPMSVRQIVEHAKGRLPTRSRTPDTVVARDLSMDIKKKGEESIFIRTEPGRYTIREIHVAHVDVDVDVDDDAHARDTSESRATPMATSAMNIDRAGPLAARATSESDAVSQSTITGA